MTTLHINGQKISENSYSYDKVDNITTINGNNNYYQRYTYDELNRLVRATGYDLSVVAERPCFYDMTMQYNNMSSPVLFNQMVSTEAGTTATHNAYYYEASVQPNAPKQIGDMYYTYDAAGNPTSILNSEGKGKDLHWDAENRLRSISDSQEGLRHAYAYDHTGERILKRYGSGQQAFYNGKDMGSLFDFGESYSAYVSPYFVETNNGYTKHYYAGATRLVSKIGEGVYQDSTYISYGEEEKDQYFYFQDHLGSSTYITTLTGEVAQYAAYTPYGELFREYRNVTPYKFNGKELDAETGLYYYGARYYNPATALWLGVDPLASKYPGVSPYVYCVGNPIKYIDPDGKKWCKNLAAWGENRNVRNAIKKLESGEKAGTLVTWRDNRGYDWAAISSVSTTTNDLGMYEVVIDVDFYVPSKSDQHGVVWNVVQEFESDLWIANGHSHGGGTTWVDYTTPEDISATLGVIGAVTSVISLGASTSIGATIVSGFSLANSIDDIGTDSNGNSFLMQGLDNEGRATAKVFKSIGTYISLRKGLKSMKDSNINIIEKTNTSIGTLIDIINLTNNE